VDKFVLKLVLTNVVELSLDEVRNGRVDDDDDDDDVLNEEIVVGVGFSSNTDSLESFPAW